MMTRVLQFGTSRFLQAHSNLFLHEACEAGRDSGTVAVVKTTSGAALAGRVQPVADPAGFPVHLRGFTSGHCNLRGPEML